MQLGIFCSISGTADDLCHFGKELRRIGKEGGGQDILRRVGIYLQPVAKVARAADERLALHAVGNAVIHIARHHFIVFRDDRGVAVGLVERPREDDGSVLPARVTVKMQIRVGRSNDDDLAVGILRLTNIGQPLAVEGIGIIVIERGLGNLVVIRPAQPLIALWAVGGNGDIVAAQSPQDVGLELVEHGAAGLKGAQLRRIAVEHKTRDHVRLRCRLQARNLHILEAVIGKARDINLRFSASGDVDIRCLCRAEVCDVKRTVLIEHLAIAKGELLPRRQVMQRQTDDARKVLPQIKDICLLRRAGRVPVGLCDLLGRQFHGVMDCGIDLRNQAAVFIGNSGVRPAVAADLCRCPRVWRAAQLLGGVVGLTVENVVCNDGRACVQSEAVIRDERLHAAVGIGDAELTDKGRRVAPKMVAPVVHITAVPAVSEDRAPDVFSLPQQRGHVIGLILHAVIVIRPAGCEIVLADLLSVEISLVQAERSGIQTRGNNFPLDREVPAQERRVDLLVNAAREDRLGIGHFKVAPAVLYAAGLKLHGRSVVKFLAEQNISAAILHSDIAAAHALVQPLLLVKAEADPAGRAELRIGNDRDAHAVKVSLDRAAADAELHGVHRADDTFPRHLCADIHVWKNDIVPVYTDMRAEPDLSVAHVRIDLPHIIVLAILCAEDDTGRGLLNGKIKADGIFVRKRLGLTENEGLFLRAVEHQTAVRNFAVVKGDAGRIFKIIVEDHAAIGIGQRDIVIACLLVPLGIPDLTESNQPKGNRFVERAAVRLLSIQKRRDIPSVHANFDMMPVVQRFLRQNAGNVHIGKGRCAAVFPAMRTELDLAVQHGVDLPCVVVSAVGRAENKAGSLPVDPEIAGERVAARIRRCRHEDLLSAVLTDMQASVLDDRTVKILHGGIVEIVPERDRAIAVIEADIIVIGFLHGVARAEADLACGQNQRLALQAEVVVHIARVHLHTVDGGRDKPVVKFDLHVVASVPVAHDLGNIDLGRTQPDVALPPQVRAKRGMAAGGADLPHIEVLSVLIAKNKARAAVYNLKIRFIDVIHAVVCSGIGRLAVDPLRPLPVVLAEQRSLKDGRSALCAVTVIVRDRHAPVVCRGGCKLPAPIGNGGAVAAFHLAAVPEVALPRRQLFTVGGNENAIALLQHAALRGLQLPAENRSLRIDAERIGLVFAGQACDRQRLSSRRGNQQHRDHQHS